MSTDKISWFIWGSFPGQIWTLHPRWLRLALFPSTLTSLPYIVSQSFLIHPVTEFFHDLSRVSAFFFFFLMHFHCLQHTDWSLRLRNKRPFNHSFQLILFPVNNFNKKLLRLDQNIWLKRDLNFEESSLFLVSWSWEYRELTHFYWLCRGSTLFLHNIIECYSKNISKFSGTLGKALTISKEEI